MIRNLSLAGEPRDTPHLLLSRKKHMATVSEPVSSGAVVGAVLTIRRAILSGTRADVRLIQGELAHLRRHARRALRRAQ